MIWIVALAAALIVATAIYDLTQRQHAILRTFPIVGHFRYWLEAVGPELRQYIVTGWRSIIRVIRNSIRSSGFRARKSWAQPEEGCVRFGRHRS
jgi:hypothetical protein